MPSEIINVTGTVTSFQPAGSAGSSRIKVTQWSGAAAPVYITADGSTPVVPSPGTTVAGSQIGLSAVAGATAVIVPPLSGTHFLTPTVQLVSSGTPTVLVEW